MDMTDLLIIVGCIAYNIVVISITKKLGDKDELSISHRILLGIVLCGAIVTLLISLSFIKDSLIETVEHNETTSTEQIETTMQTEPTEQENPIHDSLASTIFSFVNSETGEVSIETEQKLREKLESVYGISVEEYDFDTVKIKKRIRDDSCLYRYTVISSGEAPEKTNELGEWTTAQLDNTVDIENTTNANGDIDSSYTPIKTILHIGTDNNTDKLEAETYLPSKQSKTYICLAELDWSRGIVDLYPIFLSSAPNKFYMVRPNLYKLDIDDTDMKLINEVVNCDGTTDETNDNLIKKPISSTNNNVTIQITNITNKEIIGTVENKNTFEIYIDKATWKNNKDTLGESLFRVKAESKQDFKFNYTDKIKSGDELSISGEMKDVDVAFSSIGKVKFTFKLE